jgi:phage baseplate assembly protein V
MDYDSDSIFPANKTGRDSELRNMFRHGKVTEVCVDATQVCCRVQYLDKDGLISKPLPVKQFGSRSTSAFYCPKVGDDVNVTMLPNGDEDGFIDGSFYNTGNPPPITDADTRHITYADGTVMEYKEGQTATATRVARNGQLTITSQFPIDITCGTAIIKAGSITLDGPVHITGALTVDGYTDLKGDGIARPHLQNEDGSGNGY